MSERGNPWESPKILEKSEWGAGVKARHGRVTCNIQIFMPKYICRACRCMSSVFFFFFFVVVVFLLMPAV